MIPQLVIFDCDGVLVDSEPIANACLADALVAEGMALDVTEVRRRYVGLSMRSVVERIEAELGRRLADDWLDKLQLETFDRLRAHIRPVAGVAAAVRKLHAAGIKTCVASSGSTKKMTLTLTYSGLLSLFHPRLYSADMVERGKPHPDLFQLAARQFGVTPNLAVVVEDSAFGVQAAVAARMQVFGYAGDPLTDEAALREAGARTFRSMAALPELLGLKRDEKEKGRAQGPAGVA